MKKYLGYGVAAIFFIYVLILVRNGHKDKQGAIGGIVKFKDNVVINTCL